MFIATPTGAMNIEKGITASIARKTMCPQVSTGLLFIVTSDTSSLKRMNPAPGMHIMVPTAAAVPMALTVSYLNTESVGTVSVPPPIPNITETQEMIVGMMY